MTRLITPSSDRRGSDRPATGRRVSVCFLALLCSAASSVWAGSGSTLTLPTAGVKARTGLRVEIDSEWLDGTGYRPVTIRVSPLGGRAAAADRMLRVSVTPMSWQWGMEGTRVDTWVELAQGATVGEKTIAVLQEGGWGSFKIEVHEDGDECKDLSGTFGIGTVAYYQWTEAAPAMLFLDVDTPLGGRGARFPRAGKKGKAPERLPDIRAIATSFLPQAPGNGLDVDDFDTREDADDNDILQLSERLARLDIRRPSALPTEWVQLTSIDMIFISLGELQQLERDLERFETLRNWVSTGPTLCVYGVGANFERLPVLEKLLDLSPTSPDTASTKQLWGAPDPRNYSDVIHSVRNVTWQNQWAQPFVQPGKPKKKAKPKKEQSKSPDNPRPFLVRQVESGRVVALAAEDPFPGTREDWCWLFNSLSEKDWMWYQRHGLSFQRENREYWNLLIPGVGDAPVNSFLILISLFVVVIGPVNYFVLQRRRRLYLLLLTVPLGATVVTASLLFYAVVNDGLGVRLRARSYTTIDQTNGRAVTWSRQSYYAGLAPSSGMTFPKSTAVYPIVHKTRGRYGQPRAHGRRVNWDDEQNLQQGFLNSRSTAQLIVIEPRTTEAHLVIDERNTDTARVTNNLGVVIQGLVLCDSQGQPLGCARLPPGETLQTYRIDVDGFDKQWSALFASHRPTFPIGFDPDQVENASAIFGTTYYSGWRVDTSLPQPTINSSVLERGMRSIGKLRIGDMSPRTYIAITEKAPLMSVGIDSVNEEASFHVVRGSW